MEAREVGEVGEVGEASDAAASWPCSSPWRRLVCRAAGVSQSRGKQPWRNGTQELK